SCHVVRRPSSRLTDVEPSGTADARASWDGHPDALLDVPLEPGRDESRRPIEVRTRPVLDDRSPPQPDGAWRTRMETDRLIPQPGPSPSPELTLDVPSRESAGIHLTTRDDVSLRCSQTTQLDQTRILRVENKSWHTNDGSVRPTVPGCRVPSAVE